MILSTGIITARSCLFLVKKGCVFHIWIQFFRCIHLGSHPLQTAKAETAAGDADGKRKSLTL